MCGIAGYKGLGNATEVVIEGLRRLEYRGYDSWGIATIKGDHIELLRREGKIGQVSISTIGRSSGISIGHTRWATHGGVCEGNAHPHLSFDNRVAVVHNGIVENYQELRRELTAKGITLLSQTDTEVIPHLIALEMDPEKKTDISFPEAVRRTCLRLKGSYAIVAVHQDFDEIVVARDGSPVVIGVSVDDTDKEYFVASDVTAFLDHTKDVIYMQDGHMGVINSHLSISTIADGHEAAYRIETIPWSIEEARKGEYHHFMLKEINEQPHVALAALTQNPGMIEDAIHWIDRAKRIYLIGCGTSAHAAWAGQSWLRSIARRDATVILASEFDAVGDIVNEHDAIIALSQSGETADVIIAAKKTKSQGAKLISIVNVAGSTLARMSDSILLMRSGPEICVLATKSYLSELVILADLAIRLRKEGPGSDKLKDISTIIRKTVRTFCGQNGETNAPSEAISGLVPRLAQAKDCLVIGRGRMHATALEAALKLKEASYVHAEGFAGGELKHGSIALVETGMPVVVFCDNETRELMISNAMEVRARGGWVIGVDSRPNEAFDAFIQVPEAGLLQPIVSIIPFQILTYFVAVHKGLDPDKPRNLAKSVTVK